jgi:hypothetical protein
MQMQMQMRESAREISTLIDFAARTVRTQTALFARLNDPNFLSKEQQKISSVVASVKAEIGPIKIPSVIQSLLERSAAQDRYAIILKDFASQLGTMERYESRALSKRNKAIGNYFMYMHAVSRN